MMDLKKEWFNLSEKYQSDNFIYSDIFLKIYRNYSKKNRYYHNLNHIKELLSIISNFEQKLIKPESVKFSIWFHDVVYKAWRKDNEEKSSKFAYESMIKMKIDKTTIDKTCELILLTKGHSFKTNDFDTNIFLDSDLAILGSELDKYNVYCENIRKEYFFVPKNIYKKGRITVLESFLSMENIYKTTEMQDKYEISARRNINFELQKLKN